MTVRVYLSHSLIGKKDNPRIDSSSIFMDGYTAVHLNLDPTVGQYITIDWIIHGYQEKFDLIYDLKEHVVKITLLQEVYLDSAYVGGKYTCEFGSVNISKIDKWTGKVFMEAKSVKAFNELVTAYKEGTLVLEATNETALQSSQNKLKSAMETIELFQSSFLYKIYIWLQKLNPF